MVYPPCPLGTTSAPRGAWSGLLGLGRVSQTRMAWLYQNDGSFEELLVTKETPTKGYS